MTNEDKFIGSRIEEGAEMLGLNERPPSQNYTPQLPEGVHHVIPPKSAHRDLGLDHNSVLGFGIDYRTTPQGERRGGYTHRAIIFPQVKGRLPVQ